MTDYLNTGGTYQNSNNQFEEQNYTINVTYDKICWGIKDRKVCVATNLNKLNSLLPGYQTFDHDGMSLILPKNETKFYIVLITNISNNLPCGVNVYATYNEAFANKPNDTETYEYSVEEFYLNTVTEF